MKDKKPFISIIIPTYNRAKYLPEAIDSVLHQEGIEGLDYEIIVIDDGSTDNTVELLENKYQDTVRLIKLPHSGKPAIARNAGMRAATGELIAFQDSDDVWVRDKLSKQLGDFNDSKVVLSYGNCGYITGDGKVLKGKYGVDKAIPVEGYAFLRKVSKQSSPTPTPTVILRRSVIDKIGLFNEKLVIATDTDYFIRVATQGNFSYCDKILVYMRRDGSNISMRPDETGEEAILKHEVNRINMFKHLLNELKLNDTEKAALKYRIAELHFEAAASAKTLGQDMPFELSNVKLPRKPKELVEVDKIYGRKLIDNVKQLLLRLFSNSPEMYASVWATVKKTKRLAKRTP